MSTLYSVGLMNQLGDALEKASYTSDDVTKLKLHLDEIAQVIKGNAEIKLIPHIIDMDADPFVPDGWTVEEHIKTDQWQFDPTKIDFYLSKEQQKGKSIEGNELRKKLKGKPVLNANVLDYLLKHPEIIPDEWKKDENNNTRYIFFWGTIYRCSNGNPLIRYLYFDEGQWHWSQNWFDSGFLVNLPTAVVRK